MKYLITESNLKGLLSKSFSEVGFKNTVDKFKLSLPQIFSIYSDSRLPEFDCQDLEEICLLLIERGFLDTETIEEEYGVYIVMNEGDLEVGFNVLNQMNGDVLSGYATPFFDGDCELPIEIDTFAYMDTESGELMEHDYSHSKYVKIRPEFESFDDIIEWLNTEYVFYIHEVCNPLFGHVSYQFK